MTQAIKKRRAYSYDILRIIAIFLVIFTHTGEIGSKIYTIDGVLNPDTIGYIGLDIIRMINVPLFFMISGALLLGKQESHKEILVKRVLKFTITLCAAASLYFFVVNKHPLSEIDILLKGLYRNDSTIVHYHLWFLYPYIGYLCLLPFLRKVATQMTFGDFKYFLFLEFIFITIEQILNGAGLGAFAVPFVWGYDMIFCPIVGYYISHLLPKEYFNKKNMIIGIVASILGIVITAYAVIWDYTKNGMWSEQYLDLFTFIVTATTFYAVVYMERKIELSEKCCKVISFLGSNVFGIYIFSEMFAPIVKEKVYEPLSAYMPSLLACIVMILANMGLGLLLTSILRCIPIVKKLL